MNALPAFTCPVPLHGNDRILLGHGSGGRLSAELLRDVFLPAFANPVLGKLDDQAVVTFGDARLAFTTDSFVVHPLFFPGGDIGRLAVYGTVNDLAMGGARPLFLSVAFILEEGLPLDVLRRVVGSVRDAAAECGVVVATGDTKVVERGKADGLYVNTSGIGRVPCGLELSADRARPGDHVIVSGPLGDHGIAVLAQREELDLEGPVRSDCAPLHTLVADMRAAAAPECGGSGLRCLRDPTRGGLASALNEIATRAGVGVVLDEGAIPVREEVRGACELLGLDPLYVACEGRLVAFMDPRVSDTVLAAMHHHPLGREACRIGTVTAGPALVTVRTFVGTSRVLDMLSGDQLPRIC